MFDIDGEPVYSEEFLYNYHKNLSGPDSAITQEDINDYLELFINFKLKVKEARAQGLDTTGSFISEFNKYKDQLTESYLKDDSVINGLVKEAFERMQEEVNVSHILIRFQNENNPADTLNAHRKIFSLYEKLINGEDFQDLAMAYSEDPSVRLNKGNLGYFTVLQMVYPFESAAYHTPAGKFSQPFKTRFGYHILMVHDVRPARGKVQVAHIMLRFTDGMNQEDSLQIKEKIQTIYDSLKKGAEWNSLCADYSEDNNTRNAGGLLQPFETGRTVPSFSEVAFSLSSVGEISQPVQTPYGWHVIKLVKKLPIQPFNEIKEELTARVKRDSRSSLTHTYLISKLKKENGYQLNALMRERCLLYADSSLLAGQWLYDSTDLFTKETLFMIGGRAYPVLDFFKYVEMNQRRNNLTVPEAYMNSLLDEFTEDQLLEFEKEHLEEKYIDYKMLVREYREGILLFDLMEKEVWNKALTDSAGLEDFFIRNRENYRWDERIDALIFNTNDPEELKFVRELLGQDSIGLKTGPFSKKSIENVINENSAVTLRIESGLYQKGDHKIIDLIEWAEGIHELSIEETDYLVYVIQILPPMHKDLDEVKGKVISDYQDFLEKSWIHELKNRYKVTVNHETLSEIYKQFRIN